MKLIKALKFATDKHQGQTRKSTGLPYITHPMVVQSLINQYKGNSKHIEELQISALLHDTLEDTDTSYFEIEREFGSMVASIVLELTSDEEMILKVGKNTYLKNKMVSMSKYAFILKLLDRYSNILDNPKEKYVIDTINMMDYLRIQRVLTERQLRIVNDILLVCEDILS